MRVLDRARWREQPWKNGRGTTLEIARWLVREDALAARDALVEPRGRRRAAGVDTDVHATTDAERATDGGLTDLFVDTDGDYDVRVSLAEVTTSGPFSTFPGYRRHTFLVGRAPIQLGGVSLTAPGDRVDLEGERMIEATLSEPTHLLNVLVRASLPIEVGPSTRPESRQIELEIEWRQDQLVVGAGRLGEGVRAVLRQVEDVDDLVASIDEPHVLHARLRVLFTLPALVESMRRW